MRSVPIALTWELLHRGKWNLLLAVFGSNLLPILLLTALRRDGVIESEAEPAFLTMHVVLLQIMMFTFGAAVFSAQGDVKRLFTYPIPTTTLVTWHMLPAMVLAGVQTLASIAIWNALYDLDWPVWGPALFLAVAMISVQAAIWLTGDTLWAVASLSVVAGVLGCWFKGRYGPMFDHPTHWWHQITPGEVLTLCAFAVVAYVVGVWGVSRHRRGEPIPVIGVFAWLERLVDRSPISTGKFPTPEAAQYWFEWTKKGWLLPAAVLCCMLVGTTGWLLFSGNSSDLLEGFLAGGFMLTMGGVIAGVAIGNCGPDDTNYAMGPFLGTRPLTNATLARILLRVTALSVVLAWLMWAAATGLLYVALIPTGVISPPKLLDELSWWYLPATLLGPWLAATVLAAMLLTGRNKPMVVFVSTVTGVGLGGTLLSHWVLSKPAQLILGQATVIVIAAALIAGTIWCYREAIRNSVISSSTVSAAAIVWAMLLVMVLSARLFTHSEPIAGSLLLIGLGALAVAPPAATPLVIAWNRHR